VELLTADPHPLRPRELVRPDVVVARCHPAVVDGARDDVCRLALELVQERRRDSDEVELVADFLGPDAIASQRGLVSLGPDEWSAHRETFAEVMCLDRTSGDWCRFERLNRRFATRAARVAPPGATLWVLLDGLVRSPLHLRRARPDITIIGLLLEPLPDPIAVVRAASGAPLVDGILATDAVLLSALDEAARLEIAAVALDRADPCARGLVTADHAVVLTTVFPGVARVR
jgi:hypothetical protein